MGIEALEVRLSGGAANTSPAASTGGAESSQVVLSQLATLSAAIPGVTVVNASGQNLGVGALAYNHSGKTLTFTPPGGSVGPAVSIASTGRYLVRGGGEIAGYIIVDVISGSLSNTTDYARTVTITAYDTKLLPAVSKNTAYAGATEYFLFYLHNAGADAIKALAIQLQIDTPGVDTLSVSAISAKNTTEVQGDAAGHSYSAVGVPVVLGDLSAIDYWGVWVKRVTPAATIDAVTNDTFRFLITSLT